MMGNNNKMDYEGLGLAKGGMVFKPCAGCPTPAECTAAGKCAKKKASAPKKAGMSKGGMAKKGYNKGGYVNCGASNPPSKKR